MSLEYCYECSCVTGHAGRLEDSLYIEMMDRELGPFCSDCYSEQLEDSLRQTVEKALQLRTENAAQAKHIAELEEQLRWRDVATLEKTGAELVDDPEYPPFGETVLVKVQSALSVNYQQHTLREGQGNWSWPSFGLAWLPIPPQGEKGS